jgi:hypothetical protein
MTSQTITNEPYTLNVLFRVPDQTGNEAFDTTIVKIATTTFATPREALASAREEVKWESTVHATVTDERTGEDIFDEAGWAPIG